MASAGAILSEWQWACRLSAGLIAYSQSMRTGLEHVRRRGGGWEKALKSRGPAQRTWAVNDGIYRKSGLILNILHWTLKVWTLGEKWRIFPWKCGWFWRCCCWWSVSCSLWYTAGGMSRKAMKRWIRSSTHWEGSPAVKGMSVIRERDRRGILFPRTPQAGNSPTRGP